jgi:hypothetical protein
MKSLCLFALVAALVCVGTAHADPIPPGSGDPFTFNFDENGNGSVSVNGGAFHPLLGSLRSDPSNGGFFALTYILPEPILTGTVLIYEDAAHTILGDALRFTNADGTFSGGIGDRMIFYSQVGGGTLADTGFPQNLNSGSTFSIVENADGTFEHTPVGNTYNGISGAAVPEPCSLILVGTGLGVVGFYRRIRGRHTATAAA